MHRKALKLVIIINPAIFGKIKDHWAGTPDLGSRNTRIQSGTCGTLC